VTRVVETLAPSDLLALTPATLEDALTAFQDWMLDQGVLIVVTIVLALLARWALHRLIRRTVDTMSARATQRSAETDARGNVLATTTGSSGERQRARVQAVGSLLKSISTFVVGLVAALTVMSLIGLPLGPLIASAGVGGVAIGFGAQSLVKDFLSGIFMIFEDQYGVGDVVDTGEAIGTIEEVSLRITRLRDFDGTVWYVRNGEIIRIGNRSQGNGAAWVDMPVSYKEDIQQVLEIVREVCETFASDADWEPLLIEPPTVLGVDAITGQTVTVKVLAKTLAGENFGVQRELRARIKAAFDAHGIEGPPLTPVQGGMP
jgi:small-conductance mechanosensitive channel